MWTQKEAIALAVVVEEIAPSYGAHVALTGGLLYKEGERKDCDLLFYCIRQRDSIDEAGLLDALGFVGFEIGTRFGWVRKATWQGKSVDLFFPESYPARADSRSQGGGY